MDEIFNYLMDERFRRETAYSHPASILRNDYYEYAIRSFAKKKKERKEDGTGRMEAAA